MTQDKTVEELQNLEEYEVLVYHEEMPLERGTTEKIIKIIGEDFTKDPRYRVVSPGMHDNDGISETFMADTYIYKKFSIKIDDPIIEDPIIEDPTNPIIEDPTDLDKELDEKKQDMLDKYYGNRKKEKEYRKRIQRLKSHIVEKIEKTDKKEIKYMTIEKYPEKQEDEKFLQLEELQFILERFSKSQSGDFSIYEEVAKNFVEATSSDADEETKEKLINQSISILKKSDADYIETNNYAYNQHQTTQENLKTLGKYGEKVPFIKIEKIQKSEKGMVKKVIKNVGIVSYNAFLLGRNYVLAPIDKAIGTFAVAPIHKLLYNSEKNTVGIYKGMTTHRYTARRDYFEKQYLADLEKTNKKLEQEGQKPIKLSIYRYVFKTRLDAIFKYKEGNIKVLTAGANEIEKSVIAVENAKKRKKLKDKYLKKIRDNLLKTMEDIEQQIEKTKNEEDKIKLNILLNNATKKLVILEKEIEKNAKSNVGSVVQTDAMSMAQHDMANKSNITKVVTGVKSLIRAGVMYFVGKNITKFITEKISEKQWVPDQHVTTEQWIPGKFDQETLSDITIKDLVDSSKSPNVTYHGEGGTIDPTPTEPFLRGIYGSDFDGGKISGSDGIGFPIIGRTDVKINPITENSKLFDVLAETISNAKGTQITSQDLIEKIISSADPKVAFEEMLKDTRIWVSPQETGMPLGWLKVDDGIKSISDVISKGHFEEVVKVIPGHYEIVVSEVIKKVIDGRALALEMVLTVGGARDLYELLRRTKTKEEMKKEGTHKKELYSFQKDNKPSFIERNYDENKWGFVGTKKGDYASDYDENKMGKGRNK